MLATSAFRGIRLLLPVLYFGGLFFYFLHTAGSIQAAEDMGLGPTLLGLAALGLLFCMPLIYAVIRMILSRPRGSDGSSGPRDPDDGESNFDADAMIARYLARQAAEADAARPDSTPTRRTEVAKPAGFGRRKT